MIITIGRQFGSGGREIGEKVAKRLGYAFYDKEILTMAAEESGFSPAAMQHYDERPSWLSHSSTSSGRLPRQITA